MLKKIENTGIETVKSRDKPAGVTVLEKEKVTTAEVKKGIEDLSTVLSPEKQSVVKKALNGD